MYHILWFATMISDKLVHKYFIVKQKTIIKKKNRISLNLIQLAETFFLLVIFWIFQMVKIAV